MKHLAIPLILIAVLISCGACGKKGEVEKGGTARGARLVIATGGYLPPAPGIHRHWRTGGLAALGDIDGDGNTDLLVGSGAYPGSFAAFSGKDGHEIWRVKAKTSKTAAADGEKGYTFADFALIPDQNADGVPEIFVRNDWAGGEAFIFSGKDGARILRVKTGHAITPFRVCDATGNGADDLVFIRGRRLGARALAAKDLSETLNKEDLLNADPESVRQKWIAPTFPDINGDGIEEYLVAAGDKEKSELVFLSGSDFAILRRMPVERDILFSSAILANPGDLNGDGAPDLVVANRNGAASDPQVSYLAALSGADAAQLWQVAGTSLPGGPTRIAVDAKTGQERKLPVDIGFGNRVTFLTDLDGDGAREIACALPTLVAAKRTTGVLIFSGATGERLATLILAPNQGRLLGGQMLLLLPLTPEGRPALAVSGILAKHKYMVAVFDLPAIKSPR